MDNEKKTFDETLATAARAPLGAERAALSNPHSIGWAGLRRKQNRRSAAKLAVFSLLAVSMAIVISSRTADKARAESDMAQAAVEAAKTAQADAQAKFKASLFSAPSKQNGEQSGKHAGAQNQGGTTQSGQSGQWADWSNDGARALANSISAKFKTGPGPAMAMVSTVFGEAAKKDVDPILALAIMAKESSFNPNARSSYGAEGLMQVYRPAHPELFPEIETKTLSDGALRPTARAVLKAKKGALPKMSVKENIGKGIAIFSKYLKVESGDPVRAAQRYNGTLSDQTLKYSVGVASHYREFRATYLASAEGLDAPAQSPSTEKAKDARPGPKRKG